MHCFSSRYSPNIVDGNRGGRGRRTKRFRRRRSYMLVSLHKGSIEMKSGGRWESVGAPACLFLPPSRKEQIVISAASQAIYVVFDVVPVEPGRKQPGMMKTWGVRLPDRVVQAMWESCGKALSFCAETWWRGPFARLRANARLSEWLASLIEYHVEGVRNSGGGWLTQCQSQASEQLERGLNVSQWARLQGMTRTDFSHRFNEAAGITPRDWLAGRRRLRAESLLLVPGMRVCEVAERCGSKSSEAFTHFFRREKGLSPTAWVTTQLRA